MYGFQRARIMRSGTLYESFALRIKQKKQPALVMGINDRKINKRKRKNEGKVVKRLQK